MWRGMKIPWKCQLPNSYGLRETIFCSTSTLASHWPSQPSCKHTCSRLDLISVSLFNLYQTLSNFGFVLAWYIKKSAWCIKSIASIKLSLSKKNFNNSATVMMHPALIPPGWRLRLFNTYWWNWFHLPGHPLICYLVPASNWLPNTKQKVNM